MSESMALCACGVLFFFQAEDGIRDVAVTGVQTCALPIWPSRTAHTRNHPGASRCSATGRLPSGGDEDRLATAGRHGSQSCDVSPPHPLKNRRPRVRSPATRVPWDWWARLPATRSEEHTSELQSRL